MTGGATVRPGSPLAMLAERAGVGIAYRDWQWRESFVSEQVLVTLLGILGYPADSSEAVARSLEEAECEAWQRPLAPVATASTGDTHLDVALNIPQRFASETFSWVLDLEDGDRQEGTYVPSDLPCDDRREIGGEEFVRRRLSLPAPPMGYHTLTIAGSGPAASFGASQAVIAAPDRCWRPEEGEAAGQRWGLAVQLYALRTGQDWGIGDYSGLAALGEQAARFGISVIGVNPLHVLHSEQGGNSPYFPSHRLFLNPLYIDVTAVPEFAGCGDAQDLVRREDFRRRIDELNQAPLIDYSAVSEIKLAVLEMLYDEFRARHLADIGATTSERASDFRRFQRAHGSDLRRFAVFEALSEAFGPEFPWRCWPEGVRRPDGGGIPVFEEANLTRIEFFEYLQWEGARQLAAAAETCCRSGMNGGLYGDLALGGAPDGGEAWANQGSFAFGVRVGAPPDAFNQLGQDWGFPPFHPGHLRDSGYRPFAAMLEAAMRSCAALRIDHVMGLARLYWIPHGMPATAGAYVGYPLDDLLAVVRLESHRNRCVVVGEDLGTVPEGFREHLAASGLLSYRVMYFERADDGGFIAPHHYPPQALATVSTHDLPTLAGYWNGRDLDAKADLDLFPSPEAEAEARRDRDEDRRRLRDYLAWHVGLPGGAGGEAPHRDLAAAVLRALAKTPCQLAVIQIEDLIGLVEQANMPGTVDQHPNWRRRLPADLQELFRDPIFEVLRSVAGG